MLTPASLQGYQRFMLWFLVWLATWIGMRLAVEANTPAVVAFALATLSANIRRGHGGQLHPIPARR